MEMMAYDEEYQKNTVSFAERSIKKPKSYYVAAYQNGNLTNSTRYIRRYPVPGSKKQ